MRSISSVRSLASIDTVTHSGTVRSKSCSCSTLTSLASVNNRLRKVIVHAVLEVQLCGKQCCETQKGFLIQMGLIHDLYVGGIRQQHPSRNLQPPSGSIHDSDRAVSSLGFADDLKAKAAEWVERIEDTNELGFCAQGIVGVVASIPIFTALCPAAAYHRTTPAGSLLDPTSVCR